MPTLTNLATASTATVGLVDGYDTARPGGAREHVVLGSPRSDFTVRPVGTRRGRLELVTFTRSAGVALHDLLSQAGPFELTDVDLPDLAFLVTGEVRIRYEASHTAVVSVDYTEVRP